MERYLIGLICIALIVMVVKIFDSYQGFKYQKLVKSYRDTEMTEKEVEKDEMPIFKV